MGLPRQPVRRVRPVQPECQLRQGAAASRTNDSRGELDAKAGPAAAARLRVGIGDPESGAAQILDEINRRALDQLEAHWIDDEFHAVGLRHQVVCLRLGKLELVGEAGTAAAVDGKPEYGGL